MSTENLDLHTTRPAAQDSGCACGDHSGERIVLDVRAIPHAIRHATVFGALEAIAPGFALDLVAPHDPVPLLAQIADRHPDGFDVTYVQSGPEAWTVRLTRIR